MRYLGVILVSLMALAANTPALALVGIELEAMGGQRTNAYAYREGTTDKTARGKATELAATLHWKPVPLAPFSLGLFYRQDDYDLGEMLQETYSAILTDPTTSGHLKGSVYGGELKLWFPLGRLRPYLRAAYGVGSYELKMGAKGTLAQSGTAVELGIKADYEATATEGGLGIAYLVTPLFGLFLEGHVSQEQLKLRSAKSYATGGGQTAETPIDTTGMDDTVTKPAFGSTAARLGLFLGL